MPPSSPHLINGKVFDIYSIALVGASVSIVHENGTLTATTNSIGQYTVSLGSLSSWSQGDTLTITASLKVITMSLAGWTFIAFTVGI